VVVQTKEPLVENYLMRTLNTTEEERIDKYGRKYIFYRVVISCELCGAEFKGMYSKEVGRRYSKAIREAIEHKCHTNPT